MKKEKKKESLGITELVFRDAHQSLLATRMRTEDMLPIAPKLDQVGFWSMESWGGATFDACIRYLGEDPWERIRKIKAAMPNTPQQMLFRGQNILGYRHYADDVVEKFVERATENGVDIFRIFDALNDLRNLETSIKAVLKQERHAQGTMSYTVSPVHTIELWVDMAQRIQDLKADSICIKDMAGLLKPFVAFELVSLLKEKLEIPIHIQCHATTGLSTATYLKCIEAGIDNVDTAISSMSMTYGHSPTESIVSILDKTERDTGLNLELLEEIAAYFRKVRKKYSKFEGSLKGVDSRILVAQVPGGMLTNLENQLREQNASDKLDEVLDEIPKVRKDLGYLPLVTPTSQIVGSQSVLNVLMGKYKSLTKETEGILKGEYGVTPRPVDKELQLKVLDGDDPIICRPADLLKPELKEIEEELEKSAKSKSFSLANNKIDDVLSYALFPQVALYFFENRGNPSAFEPIPNDSEDSPTSEDPPRKTSSSYEGEIYSVKVDGREYTVEVGDSKDEFTDLKPAEIISEPRQDMTIKAPLAGNIFKVLVEPGSVVGKGDVVIILEAMKMETEVSASRSGTVKEVSVSIGDKVSLGESLISLSN